MAEGLVRSAEIWLVVQRGRYPLDLHVVTMRQKEPALRAGERAVRIRLEVEDSIWTPQVTPGTTIQVKAPVFPEPEVLIAELPHSDLADRPTDPEEE